MRTRILAHRFSALLPVIAISTLAALAEPSGNAGFEKLKSLAGTWEAKHEDGSATTVTYKVVSGGSAIVETISYGKEPEAMVTMYHLDGSKLMLTHYCGAGNQPRMVAKPSADPNKLTFAYLDATNLKSPDDGHMNGLTVTFEGPDSITQAWAWKANGKESTDVFKYHRLK
ncbi:MAG: hypothetical protein LAO51_15870 [Acidobacteriia bacterium]|nr:hypothetical protein [Terriglobia bacterium]